MSRDLLLKPVLLSLYGPCRYLAAMMQGPQTMEAAVSHMDKEVTSQNDTFHSPKHTRRHPLLADLKVCVQNRALVISHYR